MSSTLLLGVEASGKPAMPQSSWVERIVERAGRAAGGSVATEEQRARFRG
jgi:hypothetical protein